MKKIVLYSSLIVLITISFSGCLSNREIDNDYYAQTITTQADIFVASPNYLNFSSAVRNYREEIVLCLYSFITDRLKK